MAADLIDVRGKVTTLGHCALTAYSRAHGVEISEVLRDLVEVWARKQAHGSTLLQSCMRAKGLTAADAGIVGNGGESLDWGDGK